MDAKSVAQAVAIADALGAPHEFDLSPKEQPSLATFGQHPDVQILGGLARYGTWTDDTQMLLMAAHACRGVHPLTQYRENLLSWSSGAFTAQGSRLDVGLQTAASIRALRSHRNPEPTDRAGNAALMVATGAWIGGATPDLIGALVRTTHNSDEAATISLEWATLLGTLSRGGALSALTLDGTCLGEVGWRPTRGRATDTAIDAWIVFNETDGFVSGVSRIIAETRDTDSIAAAFAALWAAAGRDVPVTLMDTLLGQDVIAEALAGPTPEPVPADGRPGVWTRFKRHLFGW